MRGDSLWPMLAGTSSGGNTEILLSVCGLPHVHMAATLTEAALLSGTPKRDPASTIRLRNAFAVDSLWGVAFSDDYWSNTDGGDIRLGSVYEIGPEEPLFPGSNECGGHS